ncbi:putative salutaridinol 7-O-acetyltransferase [Rosa chinensis]|uniref:Putative salutaridinol 7-O-acetyltransferase n=1 Tax=Rosa chinensis TaxID=74649 RepID=A0A2P6RFM5_ROSCH|nr:putative salutaridinol 7-O-acetyltransferase [Rosa chinensis]
MTHPLVKIISRKMIKPSSPTPHHQRNLQLSFLDQLLPPTLYPSIIFFYSSPTSDPASTVSESLHASLSKSLVLFYPLAGRLKTAASVHCNDEGAHFLEARVNCQLSDLLKVPEHKLLNNLIPDLFNCGGIAVAASPIHKIGDAGAYYKFIQTWAAIHRGESDQLVLPEFNGASVLPPRELSLPNNLGLIPNQKLTTRTFVFDVTKIASLKAKIGGTHVELVSAIILRSALAASHKSKPETTSSTNVLSQIVSFRNRIVPAVAPNVMGNWFWSVQVVFKQNETELQESVAKMRKGVTDFYKEKADRFKGQDGFRVVSESLRERGEFFKSTKGCINLYRGTSLCKLPVYEIDFGWRKPTWVTSQSNHKNLFLLIDTKHGDGIEVWVTLDEEEMAIFESEEELLSFACANPSAIVNHQSHSRM